MALATVLGTNHYPDTLVFIIGFMLFKFSPFIINKGNIKVV